jgi:hypothetical protein
MKEKWLWWLVVITGITALIFYFIKTPAKGKISYQPISSSTPTPMGLINYDGNNFSFAYENKYELRENASGVELVGKSGVPIQIVVTDNKINSSDIEDASGVLMRRLKKDVYDEEKINWGDTEGLLFKRKDVLEWSAFFIKSGQEITVSMTANTNDENGLRDEFQKIVDSMEIKK